jgi:steroid Delta-isomerase
VSESTQTDTGTVTETPVVAASQASWRCVQSGDREGWLALMSDDIVIEDPIGEAVTNPDGNGVRGKEAVAAFYDANIGPNQLTVTREASFPSSSPNEIAYILVLHTVFPNGFTATVRGVFTYTVDDGGLITNLRGYWNMDAMTFGQQDAT